MTGKDLPADMMEAIAAPHPSAEELEHVRAELKRVAADPRSHQVFPQPEVQPDALGYSKRKADLLVQHLLGERQRRHDELQRLLLDLDAVAAMAKNEKEELLRLELAGELDTAAKVKDELQKLDPIIGDLQKDIARVQKHQAEDETRLLVLTVLAQVTA